MTPQETQKRIRIEEIRKAYCPAPGMAITGTGRVLEDIQLCISIIDQLQANQRWIPTSERLPEKDPDSLMGWSNTVLVTDGECRSTAHYNQECQQWDSHFELEEQITHWMPLPAGPQPSPSSAEGPEPVERAASPETQREKDL